MDAEITYLERRIFAEKTAATRAVHPAVRQAHEELASLYRSRLSDLSGTRRPFRIGVLEVV